MIVMAPSDENECRQMLYTGHVAKLPAAVRYPRGAGKGVTPESTMEALLKRHSRLINNLIEALLKPQSSPIH